MTSSQRFPLRPATPSPGSLNLGLTIPAAPPAPVGGCTPSGPYIVTCVRPYPDGDSILFVLGILGLSEGDVVHWDVTLGGTDTIVGSVDAHAVLIQYMGGDGGTATATVNGAALDTITYGTSEETNLCVSPDAWEP